MSSKYLYAEIKDGKRTVHLSHYDKDNVSLCGLKHDSEFVEYVPHNAKHDGFIVDAVRENDVVNCLSCLATYYGVRRMRVNKKYLPNKY